MQMMVAATVISAMAVRMLAATTMAKMNLLAASLFLSSIAVVIVAVSSSWCFDFICAVDIIHCFLGCASAGKSYRQIFAASGLSFAVMGSGRCLCHPFVCVCMCVCVCHQHYTLQLSRVPIFALQLPLPPTVSFLALLQKLVNNFFSAVHHELVTLTPIRIFMITSVIVTIIILIGMFAIISMPMVFTIVSFFTSMF